MIAPSCTRWGTLQILVGDHTPSKVHILENTVILDGLPLLLPPAHPVCHYKSHDAALSSCTSMHDHSRCAGVTAIPSKQLPRTKQHQRAPE